MAQPVLLILCGLPFAGKTTLAKLFEQKGFKRITVDDINIELGIEFSLEKQIDYDDWVKAYAHYYKSIRNALTKGESVIADGVAYMRKERDELREIAASCNAKAYVVYVPTSEHIAKERWQENKKTGKRQDIREEDFDEVIHHFKVPTEDEHTIVVPNQDSNEQTIEQIIQNL
ncbi:MAG TPA: ATP-binding protein [Patescibacteria group bacterium]|nr:ATP-binding protein [Patescibacteria group bacterium]